MAALHLRALGGEDRGERAGLGRRRDGGHDRGRGRRRAAAGGGLDVERVVDRRLVAAGLGGLEAGDRLARGGEGVRDRAAVGVVEGAVVVEVPPEGREVVGALGVAGGRGQRHRLAGARLVAEVEVGLRRLAVDPAVERAVGQLRVDAGVRGVGARRRAVPGGDAAERARGAAVGDEQRAALVARAEVAGGRGRGAERIGGAHHHVRLVRGAVGGGAAAVRGDRDCRPCAGSARSSPRCRSGPSRGRWRGCRGSRGRSRSGSTTRTGS